MNNRRFDDVVRDLAIGASRRSLLKGTVGAILGGGLGSRIRPAAAATILYPDVRPRNYGGGPDGGFWLDLKWGQEGGRKVLHFATAVWNAGPGPVELRGKDIGTGSEKFFQVLYDHEGGEQERRLPSTVFEYHRKHGHWHFNDWVHTELFRLGEDGRRQKIGNTVKNSFCVRDDFPVSDYQVPPVPRAPESAVYTGCTTELQGLSVGWVDKYTNDLPDQWFVLGDKFLPKGRYLIYTVAEPLNLLAKGTERNKSSATYCFQVNEAGNLKQTTCPRNSRN